MANRNELIDNFEFVDAAWQVMEAKDSDSRVDGKHILARAMGPAFVVNGASANGRFYTEALWKKVISTNTSRLKDGQMLGTVGHDQPLDDKALGEGKASHMVSKIWIDKQTNIGMLEILVLNSKTGKELNTLLRAGMKFPVSSRGFGGYDGKTEDGLDVVDANNYHLECFDFVRVPGVASAVLKVVESLENPLNKSEGNVEKFTMENKEILEVLTKEKLEIQSQLENVIDKNQSQAVKLEALEGKLQLADADKQGLIKKLTTVQEDLTKSSVALTAFEQLGDAETITEAFESAMSLSKRVTELGTIETIEEELEILETYKALGSVEAIAEVLKTLEEYISMGTPEEIQQAFGAAKELATSMQETAAKAEAEVFAKESGVEAGLAEKLLAALGKDEAASMVESLKATDTVYDLYHKKDTSKPKETKSNSIMTEGLTTRLFRQNR